MQEIYVFARITPAPSDFSGFLRKITPFPFCHCCDLSIICTAYSPLQEIFWTNWRSCSDQRADKADNWSLPLTPFSRQLCLLHWFWRSPEQQFVSQMATKPSSSEVCSWQILHFSPFQVRLTREEAGGKVFTFCLRLETAQQRHPEQDSELLQPPIIRLNSSQKRAFVL